ncbi:DUF4440 domain-containing protein [Streptomyces murinus]|uniref:DUF4440 domain-containing protein n=1 Tax=Streptomyces murinus TaxID=33900 RepID=UPI003F47EF29
MTDDERKQAVRAAIDGEIRLLDPEVRAVPALVLELLDLEFTEFGAASGRRWDMDHLTYFADNQGRRAWRSSLWRLTETGWRMYFHQGTLTD